MLALARAGVLEGRRTTELTRMMEGMAVWLTRASRGGHYRTYPESVEAEVRRLIGRRGRFLQGPVMAKYAGLEAPHAGFVVADGNYLSARWPGDAWTLGVRMNQLL